ncbi:cystathionine beta-lyase [Aquimarina sp. EL_43]|uniref:MalY/PatB family protein n=1 Tax=unclassified Aquimarina TaxID=2627091 RepID=UPI0018CA99BC|nr:MULTISPECIES: PatB family C-S lyase [unclassified Aquimarina]MBG6129461.1 cystathionine beta-lyase [Aquimarina sp. EL_35]MBG6150526.1 cystathionine beta-lyase [Aquimarina sp. EL_32]MBG6168166.1 cystathionine beta-lyase [Aquimarina sp. EL_43]
MSSFDKTHTIENNFAKSNPNYLKSMFGSTDVMPLWIADMDFEIAKPIQDALQKLIVRNIYAYEFITEDVFKAISDWNFKRHQLKLNPKSFVQVSGVLTGIGLLIRELSEKGDSIMVQTPVYHQFYKVIESANRKVVSNKLKVVDGQYKMDFEDIERKLKTLIIKAILFFNPHNPVGRVWKKEELQKLIDLANKYNVTIISDEIHSDIVYSKSQFNSIASLNNNEKHIAVIGSPAKTFGMQSISNGYLYIPNKKMYTQVKSIVGSLYLDHGSIYSANATIAAYTKGEEWLNDLLVYLEKTMNWIIDFIETELPQITLYKPEGTYQIWLDFSTLHLSDNALKHLVVHQAKLALTPGDWFERSHTQFMRMNIASPLSKIQQAFYQLKKAIDTGLDASFDKNTNTNNCCSC